MDSSDERYAVYAEFGFAAEKAQCLELDAGNVILAHLQFWRGNRDVDEETREWFRQLASDMNRRTLGNLLKHRKGLATYDENILDAIDAALEKRNYLVHRFFPSHNFAIFSVEGRQEMVEELQEIQRQFDRATMMLNGIAGTLDKAAGKEPLSQELLEQLVADGKSIAI
jgi:hypothetical protein